MISLLCASPSTVLPPKQKQRLERGLLVLTVASAAISLHPSLRIIGSLATRSIAFSSTAIYGDWSNDSRIIRAARCVKLLAIAVGIIGVATMSRFAVVASLIGDLSFQLFNLVRAFIQADPGKILMRTKVTMVDSLALAAVVTGTWPFMVVAAAVSAVAMLTIAIKVGMDAENCGDAMETSCYIALAVLGAVSALNVAERHSRVAITAHFMLRNRRDHIITLYGNRGVVVGEIKPGEVKEIIVPVGDCGRNPFGGPNSWFGTSMIRESCPESRITISGNIEADSYTYETKMIQAAMPTREFPTLPLTGTAIVADEIV